MKIGSEKSAEKTASRLGSAKAGAFFEKEGSGKFFEVASPNKSSLQVMRTPDQVIQRQGGPVQTPPKKKTLEDLDREYWQKSFAEWALMDKIREPIAREIAKNYAKRPSKIEIPDRVIYDTPYGGTKVIPGIHEPSEDRVVAALMPQIKLKKIGKGNGPKDWTWTWKDDSNYRAKTPDEKVLEAGKWAADEFVIDKLKDKYIKKPVIESAVKWIAERELLATASLSFLTGAGEVVAVGMLIYSVADLLLSLDEQVEKELSPYQQQSAYIVEGVKAYLQEKEDSEKRKQEWKKPFEPYPTVATDPPVINRPHIQRKLIVNTPGDAYEQEADQVADQVMRMKDGDAPFFSPSVGAHHSIQRKCDACEQEKEEKMHRKETNDNMGGQAAPPIVSEVISSGGGHPLDADTKGFMENRMGQDFSQVRVHTDARAAESAAAIQAKAYTSGQNVVFGEGQYQPGSESGKRLLAHELVHVGQQSSGKANKNGVLQRAEAASSAKGGFENSNTAVANIFLIKKEWASLGDKDNRKLAYILATVEHECGFRSRKEVKQLADKTQAQKDLIATQDKYWSSGFYGRGFVQLTHKSNYEKMSAVVGQDLVKSPDLALEPKNAAKITVYGMINGTFTNVSLKQYFNDKETDYTGARKIINGTDRAEEIAKLAESHHSWLAKKDAGESHYSTFMNLYDIQQVLKDEGFLVGIVDGLQGRDTNQAIVKFKQKYKLPDPTKTTLDDKAKTKFFEIQKARIGTAGTKGFDPESFWNAHQKDASEVGKAAAAMLPSGEKDVKSLLEWLYFSRDNLAFHIVGTMTVSQLKGLSKDFLNYMKKAMNDDWTDPEEYVMMGKIDLALEGKSADEKKAKQKLSEKTKPVSGKAKTKTTKVPVKAIEANQDNAAKLYQSVEGNYPKLGTLMAGYLLTNPALVKEMFTYLNYFSTDDLAYYITLNAPDTVLAQTNKPIITRLYQAMDDGWTDAEEYKMMAKLKPYYTGEQDSGSSDAIATWMKKTVVAENPGDKNKQYSMLILEAEKLGLIGFTSEGKGSKEFPSGEGGPKDTFLRIAEGKPIGNGKIYDKGDPYFYPDKTAMPILPALHGTILNMVKMWDKGGRKGPATKMKLGSFMVWNTHTEKGVDYAGRLRDSNHGASAKAIDLNIDAGEGKGNMNFSKPEAIDFVLNVLKNAPKGTYEIGLPRQGDFFDPDKVGKGHSAKATDGSWAYTKIKSAKIRDQIETMLKNGYVLKVITDNDNHLHFAMGGGGTSYMNENSISD